MQITSKEFVQKYIEFFKSKNHAEIPSASLIPENDPTVLFTTAGMHPLVPYLMGEKHSSGNRLVNYQRCIRTGDIDEVGDDTHCTFLTMLGNWSLGDYFKKESIAWSFEFLTKELGLPLEKLAFSVFEGDKDAEKDQESADFWLAQEIAGEKKLAQKISEKRIAFLDKNENWWGPAGKTGPCGPDTEIFYWVGEDDAPESFDTNDENWVEIWNNVFMQYNKTGEGVFEPLKQKNVDTGFGLERAMVALQKTKTVYEIDLIAPIYKVVQKNSRKKDDQSEKSIRIVTDHVRTAVMMIADGVEPSNKDQGYVLRRLIRRSVRHARQLGVKDNEKFFTEIAEVAIKIAQDLYPHVENDCTEILIKEVQKFEKCLQKGLKELEKIWEKNKKITGEDAFDLYQSYGFPLELTEEVTAEYGQDVDHKVFHKEFQKHQETSRKGAAKKFEGGLADHSEETVKLHTATHLMHTALKKVLGEKVQQKGSNITAERLRFDFNYPEKVTPEQITEIEKIVNQAIEKELSVHFEELKPQDAKQTSALGYFEEKYAQLEKVKVYFVGEESDYFSVEICGGPHVKNTKEIGKFKIKKQESASAGVRRFKATIG